MNYVDNNIKRWTYIIFTNMRMLKEVFNIWYTVGSILIIYIYYIFWDNLDNLKNTESRYVN